MKIRPIILILFIAAFIAMTIRVFFIESYKIATDSMSDTHKSGVCLLVEKWTLGALIPFSHRQRVSGFGSIERNDLIVYKQPLIRPSSPRNRDLLSRCIGLPGETLYLSNDTVLVNNQLLNRPKTIVECYRFSSEAENTLKKQIIRLKLSAAIYEKGDVGYVYLNKWDWYKLYTSKPLEKSTLQKESWVMQPIHLKIPKKGMKIPLNDSTLQLYGNIIQNFEEVKITRDSVGRIYKNGYLAHLYVFKQNYYFLMNDHQGHLNDSRQFGVIPESLFVGRACFVLFSPENKRFMQKISN